jgi:guanylate kinase
VFVDEETFQRMVDAGEFAEWAEVHGNRYGTTRAAVSEALDGGRDVLFDIDWQGGRQLKAQFEQDAVLIWILPPSLRVLEQRLRHRATDDPAVIERRLEMAKLELQNYGIYHYVVVNEDLVRAYDEVRSIYVAAHLTTARNGPHAEKLLAELRSS